MSRLVGILIILFVCLQAGAQEAPCTRRYLVAVSTYAPHFYRDFMNRPKGLTHDFIEILRERMGCVFIEKDLARPVVLEQMKTGRMDLAFLMAKNLDYDRSGIFFPIYLIKRELVVDKAFYSKEKSFADYLNDKKITYGTYIGSRAALKPAEESELFKKRRILEAVDVASIYDFLKHKRVQAVMMSPMINDYHIKRLKIEDQVVRILDGENTVEVGIYFSKRRISKNERTQIEAAIESMKLDGTLLRLLMNYIPKESDVTLIGENLPIKRR